MIRVPKFFNTAGPIQPDIHYNTGPLTRVDLEELESLIYQRKYFMLHAPRQTGKTSCLVALRDYLNARGEFYAVYKEIISRELTWARQQTLIRQAVWYMNPDNSIDMEKLLLNFQQFFRENADSWIERFDYKESGPQLLLRAFLQRVMNGGGYIGREYGLGRGRTDLLIRKPLTDGYGGPVQRIVLELKIKHGDLDKTIAKGLEQTVWYMDRCGDVSEGHFIVFNWDKGVSWDEKIWNRREEYGGRTITVWGM